MCTTDRTMQAWLQVSNIRFENGPDDTGKVWVQVHGDRAEREPVWWPVALKESGYDKPGELVRAVLDGLDKKRTVLAALSATAAGKPLEASRIRIQFAEAGGR